MDIWSRIFRYSSAAFGAIILLIVLMVLSNAENGMLTVEGLQHMEPQLTSFYEFILPFVYVWMALGLFIFGRFLMRMFRR
ncbi:MAG: hypothetical protein ISEC1_P0269 [Thiomicrorhabdus sp.]|nr:MAG: hypothetical protein ISEC1_P0269 [Thiomicrorhabdus sp.]